MTTEEKTKPPESLDSKEKENSDNYTLKHPLGMQFSSTVGKVEITTIEFNPSDTENIKLGNIMTAGLSVLNSENLTVSKSLICKSLIDKKLRPEIRFLPIAKDETTTKYIIFIKILLID